MQIPGNEEADRLANCSSHLGETWDSTRTVTEGGLQTVGKQGRAELRQLEGY